ncbi:ABC transporter permease [Kiritimatiellota bacterium B12222]|nr:ABC transporter permease [Kiritimatiellota bacterium B12222]
MRSLIARRELIRALTSREMKARYKGSSLGVLWSLLTPLFMAAIYAFFFRLISGRAANTSSIIVGVFAWQFTANAVQQGLGCISNNGNLVKKVSFPRVILPITVTLAAGVDYLISLIVQVGVVGFLLFQDGGFFTWHMIVLPVLFLYHAWFNLGLAMLLGSMNVYYRDTQHFVGVALSALFFMSPAMYDLSFVTRLAADMNPWLMKIYMLNPLAGIFTAYRWAFLPGEVFPSDPWMIAGMIWPLPFTLLSALIFKRAQRNFADFV